MVLIADGCRHPSWRNDFAANGKLHQFCVACGAERRISHSADVGDAARLRNGLRWIRHVAAMNSLGGTSGPQQMRALTLLAEKVLDGAVLADYDSSIGAARGAAQEWALAAGVDLATSDELGADTVRPSGESVPGPRSRSEQAEPALPVEADRDVIVLDAPPN